MAEQAKKMGGEAAFGSSLERTLIGYDPRQYASERICMTGGLTKREYFAGLAMQGLIAATAADPDIYAAETPERTAAAAVARADALLSALAKESDQ